MEWRLERALINLLTHLLNLDDIVTLQTSFKIHAFVFKSDSTWGSQILYKGKEVLIFASSRRLSHGYNDPTPNREKLLKILM